MKNIAILGLTGSIGKQVLDVLRNKSGYYKVFGLTANQKVLELNSQIKEFKPTIISTDIKETKEKLLK